MNKSLSTISIAALLLLGNSESLGMEQLLLKNGPENKEVSQKVFGFFDMPSFCALLQTSQAIHGASLLYSTTLLGQKAVALNLMHIDREVFYAYKKNGVVSKESYEAFDDKYRMGEANLVLAAMCKHPRDRISFARKVAAPYSLPWQSSKESL